MKNLLVLFVLVFTVSMCGQKEEKSKSATPPTAVKDAFAKKYPNVKKVKWEKESSNYEGGFDYNKVETSVVVDAKGNILETESEIEVSTLSKTIKDYVSKNYPNQKIKEAAMIVDSKNKTMYEAEVKGQDLLFDENGNFIKASKD